MRIRNSIQEGGSLDFAPLYYKLENLRMTMRGGIGGTQMRRRASCLTGSSLLLDRSLCVVPAAPPPGHVLQAIQHKLFSSDVRTGPPYAADTLQTQ